MNAVPLCDHFFQLLREIKESVWLSRGLVTSLIQTSQTWLKGSGDNIVGGSLIRLAVIYGLGRGLC